MGLLGCHGAVLGGSGGVLGCCLGHFLGGLGVLLGRFWRVFGCPAGVLQCLEATLRKPYGLLGHSWLLFGGFGGAKLGENKWILEGSPCVGDTFRSQKCWKIKLQEQQLSDVLSPIILQTFLYDF